MKPEALPYRSTYSRRDRLLNLVRPVFEWLGISRLSCPSLNQLDVKLERLLPYSHGWFVEAGAYDGFQQSNTYYFARMKKWRGVLIEPLPDLAARCRKRRRESTVVQCALGAPESSGSMLRLRHAGLMTMACGTLGDELKEQRRAAEGLTVQGLPADEQFVEAHVRTLTEVLRETPIPADFDLLSLDVEGAEVAALRGLDFAFYRPKAICVEVLHQNLAAVKSLLSAYYGEPEFLTQTDHYSDCFFVLRPQSA